jgi:hypothetical protein
LLPQQRPGEHRNAEGLPLLEDARPEEDGEHGDKPRSGSCGRTRSHSCSGCFYSS